MLDAAGGLTYLAVTRNQQHITTTQIYFNIRRVSLLSFTYRCSHASTRRVSARLSAPGPCSLHLV